jgi:hypothetical protein
MVIVQTIIAVALRSLGRIANTALGWATTMLFGKVPQERQYFLSGIAFASIIWMVVVVGVIWPSAGTWLLGFVTLPRWVNPWTVRVAMLLAAILLPPAIGFTSLFLSPPASRPRGAARIWTVLRGYRHTAGMAVSLLAMGIIAPAIQIHNLLRRRTTRHIPLIVHGPDYAEVVGDVQRALEAGGLTTTRQRASRALRLPAEVLSAIAGGSTDRLVAHQLTQLTGSGVEVLLYPFDLMVSGPQPDVAHVHAVLAEHLTRTKAYLTWSPEANRVEDELRVLWDDVSACREEPARQRCRDRLHMIERELEEARLPYQEWEVLFRGKLLVERRLSWNADRGNEHGA